MKIHSLAVENVKRVKAVTLEPAKDGLTVIGGRNAQGKTSVLDAIAWALGGGRYAPSDPRREGSIVPPYIRVELDNGLVVERKGKNSDLTVTDPTGRRAGQKLLDELIGELALDLPRFMAASDKQKGETLLKIIGVGDQLKSLDGEEQRLYNERLTIGRIVTQKEAYCKEMAYYPDAPDAFVSAGELIRRQQDILARNGENQRKRARAVQLNQNIMMLAQQIAQKNEELERLNREYEQMTADCEIAQKDASDLQDESTAELEAALAHVEETNRKVRANLDRQKAEDEAKQFAHQYNQLTAKIDDVRRQRHALLDGANLPLPGLSVEDGALTYRGHAWDCMSASEQLRVATAIVRELNPKCGFVLLDKLEQMDMDTLHEFGQWLEAQGLQAIATRVSTGDECQIVIEDGLATAPPFTSSEMFTAGGGLVRDTIAAHNKALPQIDEYSGTAYPLRDWKKGGFLS